MNVGWVVQIVIGSEDTEPLLDVKKCTLRQFGYKNMSQLPSASTP